LDILSGLNPEQQKAVKYNKGPSLIFAGAGSGKTRVLTHKIAYLIKNNICAPHNILAVTFTNKAAKELLNRVENFAGKNAKYVNVGTFHSICARLLRREIENIGYSHNFTIYDPKDQLHLMKNIIKKRNMVLEGEKPKSILNKISNLKTKLISPEAFEAREFIPIEQFTKELYPSYQNALKKNDALDFDDLLVLPLTIFKKFPKILKKYQNLYKYILVDEYQDTNQCQFEFIDYLSRVHKKVCVVGDDDQSIYSWRGADITNILNFESIFPKCKVFKLEQNYRSTKNIITAASDVVKNNKKRADKTLWADNEKGEPLIKIEGRDEYDEAARIASNIQKEISKSKYNYKDFAIFYRTNAQNRVLEQILNRNQIPNAIVGGVRFYERKEVKDILAYLKFFSNIKDDISFLRIINTPPRGIGNKTVQLLQDFATSKNSSLFEALAMLDFIELSTRAKRVLGNFYQLIQRHQSLRQQVSLEEWIMMLIDGLEIRRYLKGSDGEETRQRLANIDELVNAINDYSSTTDKPTLEDYLAEVALIADIDTWKDKKNSVSLMTLHSAKGLEFPVVFVAGLNDCLLPLGNNSDGNELDEERRLFYVGMTRAMKKLFLTSASVRNIRGENQYTQESRFLREIPGDLIEYGLGAGRSITPSKRKSTRKSSYQPKPISSRDFRSPKSSPKQTESQKPKQIIAGSFITHKIFGVGKVMEVLGFGQNARLKIIFKTSGSKTIVAKYVRPC